MASQSLNLKNMKYTEKYTVNWHDTDANRIARVGRLVEHLQELANRQCESSGLPLDRLRDERGLGFILGALSLKLHLPLRAYDEVELVTWCRPARGYIFNRYFEIRKDGELALSAISTWVIVDVNSKQMVRISPDDPMHSSFYYDEPISPDAVPPKARISKDAALFPVGKRRIMYSDIDYNMHMNNTRYPDMICDHLCEMTDGECAYRVGEMSLSYLKESHLGATLTVLRSEADGDGNILVRTVGEQGDTCLEAVVRLIPLDRDEL